MLLSSQSRRMRVLKEMDLKFRYLILLWESLRDFKLGILSVLRDYMDSILLWERFRS